MWLCHYCTTIVADLGEGPGEKTPTLWVKILFNEAYWLSLSDTNPNETISLEWELKSTGLLGVAWFELVLFS